MNDKNGQTDVDQPVSALDHESCAGVIPSRDLASRCPDGATKNANSQPKREPYPAQLLDVNQCADYLNISVSEVRLYVKNRILRRTFLPDPIRRGHKLRRVLINKTQLDALIAAGEIDEN